MTRLVEDATEDLFGGGRAVFSPCRTWRYLLARTWEPARPPAAFIMLNPSTADAFADDPTIRRCTGFARTWGAGGLVVVNLYGLRATDPKQLYRHPDPVGQDNDRVIGDLLAGLPEDGLVVCAWGAHGVYQRRDRHMVDLIQGRGLRPLCLGITIAGQPRHPLYLRADARPAGFEPPP